MVKKSFYHSKSSWTREKVKKKKLPNLKAICIIPVSYMMMMMIWIDDRNQVTWWWWWWYSKNKPCPINGWLVGCKSILFFIFFGLPKINFFFFLAFVTWGYNFYFLFVIYYIWLKWNKTWMFVVNLFILIAEFAAAKNERKWPDSGYFSLWSLINVCFFWILEWANIFFRWRE